VALTGGIGAGKSAAASCFERRFIPVVDTDVIARALTAPDGAAIPAIETAFGNRVLDASGAMDRSVMREIVFGNPAARNTLESILHPLIQRQAEHALGGLFSSDASLPYAVLAVPLYFERLSFRPVTWRVLVVDCSLALQRRRVLQRHGMHDELVSRVIDAQVPRAIRLQMADDVVTNEGSLESLDAAIGAIHSRWCADSR
jgi:dephospho-CoA kinase